MLVPVGTTCEDAWLASSAVAARTEKMKFLVAMRPGFVAPTVAAKMSNTIDQLTRGRVLINVVTGGFPAELAADGDFTEHDERYARTQEFMQVVKRGVDGAALVEPRGQLLQGREGQRLPEAVPAAVPAVVLRRRVRGGKKVGAEEADVYLLWGETDPDGARAHRRHARARGEARAHTALRHPPARLRRARPTRRRARPPRRWSPRCRTNFEGMMQKHMSGADSEGEKRQRMLREQGEWLGPNLWTGIGRARLGVGLALVGSGENVAARIREYVDEGIDTFIFSGYPHLEESERFGKYVMPHFRGEAAVPVAPPSASWRPHDAPTPRRRHLGQPARASKSKTLAELMLAALARGGCETQHDRRRRAAGRRARRARIRAGDRCGDRGGRRRSIVVAASPTYRALYTGVDEVRSST